jgi:5-methylthioadenosine/S-adenosylhomocysteine deaminase
VSSETRILGSTIVTLDAEGTIVVDGEIAYDTSGIISYVGQQRGASRPGDIDATGSIVMPGMVNGHTHSAMTPLRGYSDNKDLSSWLSDMRRFEVRMTEDDLRWAVRLAVVEMLHSGTTACADMFHWTPTLIGDVVDAGMRINAAPAVIGYDTVAFPEAGSADGRATIEITEQLGSEFAGDAKVRISFGPHAVYTCSPELLRDVATRAARTGLGIHIHLSEDANEVERSLASFGATPIAHAASHGIFDVPTHVAHATKATDADIELLVAHGASVSHNPVSNLKIGAGVAPIPAMRDAGVTLALGTDGVASNNTLDMFEEIKLGTIIQRGVHENAQITRALDYLRMATSGGAAATGFSNAGVLASGRDADIVVLRTDTSRATPMNDPISFLAFAATSADVTDVIVAGQHIVRDGRVTTLDEAEVRAQVAATNQRIASEIGLTP